MKEFQKKIAAARRLVKALKGAQMSWALRFDNDTATTYPLPYLVPIQDKISRRTGVGFGFLNNLNARLNHDSRYDRTY